MFNHTILIVRKTLCTDISTQKMARLIEVIHLLPAKVKIGPKIDLIMKILRTLQLSLLFESYYLCLCLSIVFELK